MGDEANPETRFPDIPPCWKRKQIADPVDDYVTDSLACLSAAGPPHPNPPSPNPWMFRHHGPPFRLSVTQGTVQVEQIEPGSDTFTLSAGDPAREFTEIGSFEFTNPEDTGPVAILRVEDQKPVVVPDDDGDIDTKCGGGCWGR